MSEPARKHPVVVARSSGADLPVRPEEPSNRELLQWMHEDPKRAASLVYDRFAPDVNRLVWRLLGADPDHNDIVQQVLYRVMVGHHQVRDPDRFAAWVRSVAVRTVYAELRRRALRRILLRRAPEPQAHADLVRDVEARDLLLRARALLAKLPPKERIVFSLHFIEGRTLGEIAELSGFSMATAKRRLKAANRRFQHLSKRYPELCQLLFGEDHEIRE